MATLDSTDYGTNPAKVPEQQVKQLFQAHDVPTELRLQMANAGITRISVLAAMGTDAEKALERLKQAVPNGWNADITQRSMEEVKILAVLQDARDLRQATSQQQV